MGVTSRAATNSGTNSGLTSSGMLDLILENDVSLLSVGLIQWR
jgi:hypothetical protein